MGQEEVAKDPESESIDQARAKYPVLQYFKFGHLPGRLQQISRPFCLLAIDTALWRPEGHPETAVALRKLLEAKDAAVRAALVLLLALFVTACGPIAPPQPPGPPSPPSIPYDLATWAAEATKLCPGSAFNPLILLDVIKGCAPDFKSGNWLGFYACATAICAPPPTSAPTDVPTAPPTAPPTLSPTAPPLSTPTAAPTSTPAPTSAPVPTIPAADPCPNGKPETFLGKMRSAQANYASQNPQNFINGGSQWKWYTQKQDVYLSGVADQLWYMGIDAYVVLTSSGAIAGDLAVSDHGTPMGQGFADSFHPIASDGKIQTGGFTGQCTPRWFGPVPTPMGVTFNLPTATALPVTVTVAKCPPLETIEVSFMSGNHPAPCVGDPTLDCVRMDVTDRYVGGNCNNPQHGCPQSASKDSFGLGDNHCDPAEGQVTYQQVGSCEFLYDGGNVGRLRGKSPCSVTVVAEPVAGAVANDGSKVDVSQFSAFPFQGSM
jgi:hypothetical protein